MQRAPDETSDRGPAPAKPFLKRLAEDRRGNTLAIVGAALIPLTAMIGSGVDMSRAYMAKARLQSACDAASLAARRVMTNDTLTQAVTDEATRFFNFNFPEGTYGAEPVELAVTRPTAGTIHIAAETDLPTGIMYLFGFESMDLAVECEASHNFVNTDVVLVLDTTGSMLCETDGSDCDGDSDSKIAALREAVLALYDELEPVQTELEEAGMRLRYGIVPYSSGVNVGQILMDANPNAILGANSGETWTYQSRASSRVTQYWNFGNAGDYCRAMEDATWNGSRKECTYYPAAERTFDVSGYVDTLASGATIDVAGLVGGASKNTRWSGCIEERQTTDTITETSNYNIPADAFDLNIDMLPTTDPATRWKPYFPRIMYVPSFPVRPQVACPSPARTLQAWERDDLDTYLDALVATGGTYHDNGMIWGARLISSAGVFADSPETFNGMPVAKHVIFMTDGLLDTGYDSLYSTYGLERWDARVTPGGNSSSETNQESRHRQRFRMMCNATKGMNVNIWVVAFAETPDATLMECASSEAQVFTSDNRDELIEQFTQIGQNIGALRLTE